jgi:hypothetical protein
MNVVIIYDFILQCSSKLYAPKVKNMYNWKVYNDRGNESVLNIGTTIFLKDLWVLNLQIE